MNWLVRASLKRGTVVVLATVLLALFGTYSATRLNVELLPDVEFPVLSVVTIYPGASPGDVDAAVTVPIEGVVSGTSGLRSLQSTSSEGAGVTIAEFEFDTDLDAAERAIQSGLASLQLPQGAVRPQISRFNFDDLPAVQFGLLGDTPAALEALATGRVAPELRGLPGVARVDVTGGAQRQVRLTLDPRRLAERGVSPDQVTGALRGNNLAVPAGTVVDGSQSIPVRVGNQLTSLEQLGDLVIGARGGAGAPAGTAAGGPPGGIPGGAQGGPGGPPSGALGGQFSGAPPAFAPGGEPIRLRDVATVELADAPNATISRTNGQPSIGVEVVKGQGANTVAVVDAVEAKLAELQASGALPPGVEVRTTFDQSIAIEESISGLIKEGLLGALFAVVVIFLFLLSVRPTLVAAVSIPTSVLLAFVLMAWRGLSLNIFTLGALAIAVGRVVDDSIVVLENIVRRSQGGEPIGTAAYEGTREVAGAITASTVTTVCVFLPISLVGGVTGQFFLPFALTVAFALAASLLVALTIIPVFAALFLRRAKLREEREGRLERAYLGALRWSLGHRALTLGLALALLVGSFALAPYLGTAFLPASSQKVIDIQARAPAGASQAAVDDLARRIEAEVARGAGVETYSTTVGVSARELAFTPGGTARIAVAGLYARDTDVDAEAARLRAATRGLPGLETIAVEVVQNGPPNQNQLQVIVTGGDFRQVGDASARVLEATRNVAGLTNVTSDLATAKPEIRVAVDPDRAAARGLNAAAVAGQVRALITGQGVTEVTLDGRRLEVYAAFADVDASGGPAVEAVRDLTVAGPTGPVRLGDVATVERVDGPVQFLRVDRERAVTISGTIVAADLGRVTRDAQAAIDALGLPATVRATVGGASAQQTETFRDLGVAALIAVLLVYLAMVATFGNLRDPFAILFSLPLALIGAIAALYLTGRPVGLPALIGVLLLIGIVVTNAIVLLDRVRQERERGLDARQALLAAGRTRLRPILMTAFATILALSPLALGLNEGAIIAAELATVVIGGLLTSTLLTLLVVPVVYSLLDGAASRLSRRHGRDEDGERAGDAGTLEPDGHPQDEPVPVGAGSLVAH